MMLLLRGVVVVATALLSLSLSLSSLSLASAAGNGPANPVPPIPQNDETTAAPNGAAKINIPPNQNKGKTRARLDNLRAAIVPANSFTPPFDEYDENTGERMIHSAWAAGGSTDVHENFVRLTNDRQSKVSG